LQFTRGRLQVKLYFSISWLVLCLYFECAQIRNRCFFIML